MSALNTEEAQAETTRGRPGRKPADANRLESGRAIGRETRKTEERDRPQRVPLYEQRRVLIDSNVPEGYHGHWADSTKPGRIESLLKAGYSFVTKDGNVYSHHVTDSGVDSRVSKSGSDGVTLYLMIIPLEWYEADQAAKHKLADEQAGAVLGKLRNDPDFYSRDKNGAEGHVSRGIEVKTQDYPFE